MMMLRMVAAMLAVVGLSGCALPFDMGGSIGSTPTIRLSDQSEVGLPAAALSTAGKTGDYQGLVRCALPVGAKPEEVAMAKAALGEALLQAPLLVPKVDCIAAGQGAKSTIYAVVRYDHDTDGYSVTVKETGGTGSWLPKPFSYHQLERNPFSSVILPIRDRQGVGVRFDAPLLPFEKGRTITLSVVDRLGQEGPKRRLTVLRTYPVTRDGARVDTLALLEIDYNRPIFKEIDTPLKQWFLWSDLAGAPLANGLVSGRYGDHRLAAEVFAVSGAFLVKGDVVAAHYKAADFKSVNEQINRLRAD